MLEIGKDLSIAVVQAVDWMRNRPWGSGARGTEHPSWLPCTDVVCTLWVIALPMPIIEQAKPRTERIDIRTDAAAKRILQEAARASHKKLSDFLLENGLAAAEQTLADRRLFVLNDGHWKKFQAALDRPVKRKPRLAKLLIGKTVFD